MSKLRKTFAFAGPVSGWMIFGSMIEVIWLSAAYLAHHQSSNWATHTWFSNPNYHFNIRLGWILVIVLVAGFVMRRFRVLPTPRDPWSFWDDGLSDQEAGILFLGIVAFMFVVIVAVTSSWIILTWILNLGSSNWRIFNKATHTGGPYWYCSMWQFVVIGWSLLIVGFCADGMHTIGKQTKPID